MWLRVAFTDAITHCVSDRLLPSLVADMAERGHPIENFETRYGAESAAALGGNPRVITDWALDLGGPCHVGRPMEAIDVDGLALYVPCDQFVPIASVVRRSRVRQFASGDSYHKLKFWLHATVLTVEQYDHVLATLDARGGLAARRSQDFAAAIRRGVAS